MYTIIKIIILLYVLVFPFSAYSQDIGDPCFSLEKELSKESVSLSNVLQHIEDIALLNNDKKEQITLDEEEVFFTKTSGYFMIPTCEKDDSGQNIRIKKGGFYPIGRLIKPIAKYKYNGRPYYYGMTNTGFKALYRENHLKLLDKNETYVFSISDIPIGFCKEEKCTPEILADNNLDNHNNIHPTFRYGVVDFTDKSTILADKQTCEALNAEELKLMKLNIFKTFKTSPYNVESVGGRWISKCLQEKKDGKFIETFITNWALSFVDHQKALNDTSRKLTGSPFVLGENIISQLAVSNLNKDLHKSCPQNSKSPFFMTTDDAVLAGTEISKRLKNYWEEEEYLVFASDYLLNDELHFANKIIMGSSCDDGDPDELEKLHIFSSNFTKKHHLVVGVDSFKERMKANKARKVINNIQNGNLLGRGFIGEICGFDEYFRTRRALYSLISCGLKLKPEEEYLFVELFMSTRFAYPSIEECRALSN